MEPVEVIHVEVCQKADSTLSKDEIQAMINATIVELDEIPLDTDIPVTSFSHELIRDHVQSVLCSCNHRENSKMKTATACLKFHVYRLTQEDMATETMENNNEELAVASHWILPAKEFQYLWENMFYDSNMKQNLLDFVETTMIFADHSVNPNIISWNKVILLHGPPGTGKTSMCKALAQKIAIRLGDRFTHGELVEINSHSLFSKWFSESGKLVMKLFNEIKNLLEDSNALICVLVDEIESLAHSRKSCTNGVEPTDSIRVVNALLTQLDQIKRYPNVLILTTSNMTETVDLAFVDRVDIKQYIGHPTEQAIYKIYSSCLKELMRTELVESENLYDISFLKIRGYEETTETKHCLMLLELSKQSLGLSGRTLRKIPFLAHALYIKIKKCTLPRFLRAMHYAIEKQKEDCLEQ